MKWLQKTSITEYSLLDRTYFKRLKTSGGMLLYGTYICIRNVYLWMSSHCLCLENMWKFSSSRKRIRSAHSYLKTGFGTWSNVLIDMYSEFHLFFWDGWSHFSSNLVFKMWFPYFHRLARYQLGNAHWKHSSLYVCNMWKFIKCI